MKEIFHRISAETPLFFKRLRNLGYSVSGTGVAIVAIPGIPDAVKVHASTAIWVGLVVAAVSQLTCKDPAQLPPVKQPGAENNA